jgi:hypothetical protein
VRNGAATITLHRRRALKHGSYMLTMVFSSGKLGTVRRMTIKI